MLANFTIPFYSDTPTFSASETAAESRSAATHAQGGDWKAEISNREEGS